MLKKRLTMILEKGEQQEVVFGRTYFVMKSTDTRYVEFVESHQPYMDGKTKVYNTVSDAISAAKDNDKIMVGPGVYDEGAELAITQANLKLQGYNTSGIVWGPCSLKASSASHNIISVQANGVEISYLGLIQNTANRGIEIDHTAAVYKTHIHHCHFGGSASATYGVYAGGTYDAVDTVIEDCEFLSWATAAIYMNATRSKARRNMIFVPASGIGIEYVPNTSDRGYNAILDNDIAGANSSDTGIQLDGVPDAGQLMMSGNRIVGCATKITQTANGDLYGCENYGSTAAGGALIDIDT